jgi:ribonuclease J
MTPPIAPPPERPTATDPNTLRIIPLGGLGEVGKNMMALVYGHAAIIIDTGIMFPEADMHGVDYIIPDFTHFATMMHEQQIHIEGIVITHGHEDHTGAIAHVWNALPAPVYATALTCGLIEVKLRSAHIAEKVALHRFKAGDVLQLGPFQVETFHVCHSIPDCVGLGIQTPVGLVIHTGDFKFDQTPVDGWPTDFGTLAGYAARNPLVLLSDSTNADHPGWTPSEMVINDAFDKVFRNAKGRVIVATFASLISRIQQVADTAARFGRKLAITGSSMSDNVKMALNLGYLKLPDGLLISVDEALRMPREQVAFMATGTQGEPSSVLNRLAADRHQKLRLTPGDTVVVSAHPIPGNEEGVFRTINKLIKRGAEVIYDPMAPVHVSGHASQEEQKLMLALTRPRYFVPVHGELRHLHAHARLAEQVGVPAAQIAVIENGTVVEFDAAGQMRLGERVPGGYIFVDRGTVGETTLALLREREKLSRDGVLFASAVVDRERRILCDEPQVVARGFLLLGDTDTEMAKLRGSIRTAALGALAQPGDVTDLQAAVHAGLDSAIRAVTRRRPQIFVHISTV